MKTKKHISLELKLQKQVTSLELSERLKELGIKQESLFYWVSMKFKGADISSGTEKCEPYLRYGHGGWVSDVCVSAFTSTELGEWLPQYLKEDSSKGISFAVETDGLSIRKRYDGIGWVIGYRHRQEVALHEPEARGLMAEYLIKNKLV